MILPVIYFIYDTYGLFVDYDDVCYLLSTYKNI